MTSRRQIDGVAVSQRHEHDDVPRGSLGSREDVQERRAESQGVRDEEVGDRGEHPEEKTHQEHPHAHFNGTTELGRSGSRWSRYVAGDDGNDDTNDARTPEEGSSSTGTHPEESPSLRGESA